MYAFWTLGSEIELCFLDIYVGQVFKLQEQLHSSRLQSLVVSVRSESGTYHSVLFCVVRNCVQGQWKYMADPQTQVCPNHQASSLS